ncbi:MAG: IS30 family transposase [Pseudobutyrivibrio sp.]|nr:IS30 family transposase [Pseudobutyrivibrio sp.]
MKKLNLSERESIEIGIVRQQPLSRIALLINKHKSSIAREIKNYRIFLKGSYYAGNDCKYAKGCNKRHLCGDNKCPMFCYSCNKNCHQYCSEYVSTKCLKYMKPPYVCNACSKRRYCNEDKYFYDARVADKKAHETRIKASEGVHLSEEELEAINSILMNGVAKKGQPLAHVYATHENELIVSERTVYRYITNSVIEVRPAHLRRATGYKKRKKKRNGESSVINQQYRQGRSYQDFIAFIEDRPEYEIVEMDTVKGKQGRGKVMLTMLFRRNNVMLIFLMPDCKAESVIAVFDYLESGLGTERFQRLFSIILTDNGSEFKRVEELEKSLDNYSTRTRLFYCDPMASWQKGKLEKNHEYIRYVIPKSTSLNAYTQDDITLLVNHINSTKRPGLEDLAPYELVVSDDEDMHALASLLDLKAIPADEVNLTKSLLSATSSK